MTYICVSKLTILASDNGLSPGWRQAIIWTSSGILLIGHLGTNFSEIFNGNYDIFIQENAFESVVCEIAAMLSRPQCVNAAKEIGVTPNLRPPSVGFYITSHQLHYYVYVK